MRVLADFHHADLFESYQLTLGDRFGWEVFRPIGMEWFDRWYWSFERSYHGDAVARQYLSMWDGDRDLGDEWARDDRTHPGRTFRMVTVDQAEAQRWDLVIASVPDNYHGFSVFAERVGARFVAHFGNQWQDTDLPASTAAALVSTSGIQTRVPQVVYHQEFSLQDFRPAPGEARPRRVASFVQCLPENPRSYAEFIDYARTTPDMEWLVFGAYGTHEPDEFEAGNLPTTPDVAAEMRRTGIVWHTKEWSDGYGHVIHNAFACGRPVVGRAEYYRDKLAGPLWVDGVTSIDIGRRSRDEVVAELRRLRDDDDYREGMGAAAAARFREVVDFDADAEAVRSLLEGVAA